MSSPRRARAPEPSRRPGCLYRLLFGPLFAVALILVGEGALRLAGLGSAYQPEALGGWRMSPGMDAVRMRGGREPHDFVLSTNADGLRTRLPEARSGIPRLAIMGDSTVFGWGVDDDGSLAVAIEAGLARRGARWEVLNAGQPGYSTTQVAWLFEEVVQDYRPDLVVVFLSMHDHNRVLVSDREVLDGGRGTAAVRVTLARHSRIYQGFRLLLFPLAGKPQLLPHERSDEPRVPRVSDDERRQGLDRMRALARSWGGDVALGMLPFYADLQRPTEGLALNREGVEFARRYAQLNDVRLFDLRTCCGPGADELVFPFDRGHLNAWGNARVGEVLAEQLTEER